MTDHEVTWRIDQDVIYGGLTCSAEYGAPCRQGCGEGCGAETCDHGIGDVGYCLAEEWIEASGSPEDSHGGEDHKVEDGPVNVHWDGDAWLWTYPENGAA